MEIDKAAMEMSLRQRLSELGWPDRFLGAYGYYARLGSRGGYACFVPFGRFARWFTARTLSIEEIIPPGSKVKFLKSLKYDIAGQPAFPSFSWLFLRVMSVFAGKNLARMALFEGYIIDDHYYKNKPFSQFPFDEYLVVRSVERFDSLYEEADGTWWRIGHVALTTVTQIEVEIESMPLQPTDESEEAINAFVGRLTDRDLLDSLNVAMGEIECNPQTRALLLKIIEELTHRVIEQETK